MQQKKNTHMFISETLHREYLDKIIGFFHDERNEDIGLLAAQDVLDFFLDTCGNEIYRQALRDVKKIIATHNENLEVEINLLAAQD